MNNFKNNIKILLLLWIITSSVYMFADGAMKILDNPSTIVTTKHKNTEGKKSDNKKKEITSAKVTPTEANDIKPDDIEVAKVKKVKIGPKTKKKLGLDKEEVSNNNTSDYNDSSKYIPTTFNITFYTSTDDENANYGGMVANNKKIAAGMVAGGCRSQFGQKIIIPSFGKNIAGLEGINTFVIEDLMAESEYAKAPNRIDVFVPALPGEDEYSYSKRVNSYGRYQVKGYIVKR